MIKQLLKKIIPKLFGTKVFEFFQLINSKPFLVSGDFYEHIRDINNFIMLQKDSQKSPRKNIQLIRKYAHMLDKGMHRDDFVKGHSKLIYKNLNEYLSKEIDKKDPSVLWACEKINNFELFQKKDNIKPLGTIPSKSELSFNQVSTYIRSRRTNRHFQEKIVSDSLLEDLASLANYAASSCNKQPIKMFISNNPEISKECLKYCKGGTGYGDYIPVFISFCAEMDGYLFPKEIFLPSIDVSLGAQNFYLAAHSLGLSGSIMSWAQKDDLEEMHLRNILNIPSNTQIIFNGVLGYAKKEYLPPKRKNKINTFKIIK
tara:strand:+ start:80 stop:1024 length:945 start_codon:yes stop_codon:yes gene_type:complete